MFAHFNHDQFRRYIVAFGSLFNQIEIRRKDATGVEVQRMNVPLEFGPKERWYTRLMQDPDFTQGVRQVLPRLSYELVKIDYDATRKLNSLEHLKFASTELNRLARLYVGIPYNLTFNLDLAVKLQSDGFQIVEQILPYFTPDYTFAIQTIPEFGVIDQVPLILVGCQATDTYEGPFDATRLINWTLSFSMRGYFYGPVRDQKKITEVTVDIYNSSLGDLIDPPETIRGEDLSQIVNEDGTGRLMDEATDDTYLTHGRVIRVDTLAAPGQDPIPSPNVVSTTTVTEYDGTVIRDRVFTDEPTP